MEHEGLVRDAWDEVNGCPCCKTGYINDYLDADMDNVQLGIHSLQPNKLLVIAAKQIIGAREIHVPFSMPYGGYFWCDDCHSFELQCKAIRRYNINIHTSTDETDGDWTKLQNYSRLCEVFPRPTLSLLPTDQNIQQPAKATTTNTPTLISPQQSRKRKAKEPAPPPDEHSTAAEAPSKTHTCTNSRSTKPTGKRKGKMTEPPSKDSRQRTMNAYLTTSKQDGRTELIPMAPRVDSNVMLDTNDNSIACVSLSCRDFSTSLSSPPSNLSSLALLDNLVSPLNSQNNSVCNEEETQLEQGSVAPAVCPPASANLSDSPMEYDKRFVFI